MAASLGADAGFSVDELDDIRLALSEVFSAMGDEVDPAARAQVSFSIDTGSIHIDVRTDRPSTTIDLDELALGILRSVTDEFDATPTGVRLVKHATEAIAGSSSS